MPSNFKIAHPAVFIFGAGATKGAFPKQLVPPPVDLNFFDAAHLLKGHGTNRIARQVLKDVWDLYRRTNGIGLEAYFRDIEARARIGSFAKTANQPKDWRKRVEQITELVRRVYIHTTCDAKGDAMLSKSSPIHQGILEKLEAKDTIITFNYDCVIEESFKTADLWNPCDGYGIDVSGKKYDWARKWFKKRDIDPSKESQIILLKLHGSLNWQYKNQKIYLKQRPYYVRTRGRKVVVEKISILAPGWDKQIHKNPYKIFWRKARLNLERCKTLVILGYSLPSTDILAQALFEEIIRLRNVRKKYLKELHVADLKEEVKEKFVKLFEPALGPNGKVFKYDDIADFQEKFK